MKTLLCALLFLLPTSLGWAHPMPSSEVRLRLREGGIEARLTLPIIELQLGWQKPVPLDANQAVAEFGDSLKEYVAAHMHPVAPDGRPWTVAVGNVTPVAETNPDLQVEVTLTPPPGAPADRLTLNYDVIFHRLITHTALVSIVSDWRNGIVDNDEKPVLLAVMRDTTPSITIDRSRGSVWRGFAAVFRLGMRHIAEGTDHLLFLLVLLLPASLVARSGKWREAATVRQSVVRLLKIVTAFTLGHSLTLAAGALAWIHVSSQPIEVLIALSIFVSALHAVRPLLPGREPWIAAGFGLIHGMAFAGVIADFGLDAWHTVLSIVGFNLGIEAMQLFVVGVTVPWLLLLAQTPVYTPFRLLGAGAAAIAALGWLAERTLGWQNPVGQVVEQAASHAVWIVAGLAALSLTAALPRKNSLFPVPGEERGQNAQHCRPQN